MRAGDPIRQLPRGRSAICAAAAAALALLAHARGADAQAPGSVVVIGTATAAERAAVETAITNRLRDAAWSVVARPFSPPDVDAIAACLADDRPWPCVAPRAAARGLQQLVVARVDAAAAQQALLLKAQLLVADNDVPATAEAYCDRCDDARLRAVATRVTEQLLADAAARARARAEDTVLEVETSPPGASVLVDGRRVGAAPVRYVAAAGARAIEIQLPGYATETRAATLLAGQTTKLAIQLRPAPGVGSGGERRARDPRLVPGLVLGVGVAALIGGSVVSLTAEADPNQFQPRYLYSGPGIAVAIAGGAAAAAGGYLWWRATRARAPRSGPAVSALPGGVAAGWITTF